MKKLPVTQLIVLLSFFAIIQSINTASAPVSLVDKSSVVLVDKNFQATHNTAVIKNNAGLFEDFSLSKNLNPEEEFLTQKWQKIDLTSHIGSRGIICKDINNNGAEEIILVSGSSHLHILNYKNEDYHTTWWKFIPEGISGFLVEDFDNDSISELYVMTSAGILHCYDALSFDLLFTHNFSISGVNCFRIADIKSDSTLQILISNSDSWGDGMITAYDVETFEQIWQTTDFGSGKFEIADVNGNGCKEIVLKEGIILDGSTFEVYWQYHEAFGQDVSLNDIDNDGINEIIALRYNSVIAFDGQFKTPLWQFDTEDYNDCFLVSDVDGDNVPEIICGGNQWGEITCYSISNQQLLWTIDNPDHGATNIAIGDPNNDGVTNVMWGAGHSSSGSDHLHIASTQFYNIIWSSLDLDPAYYVYVDDINDDGIPEILVTSYGSNNGYHGGVFLIIDGSTHDVIHTFTNLTNYNNINLVKSKKLDSNSQQSELLIGTNSSFMILDGSSFQTIFSSTSLGGINTIEVADLSNSNSMEIILGSNNGRVYVLDSQTYEIIWQSVNTGTSVGLVRVDDCLNDGNLKIVFNGHNNILHMYDATTFYLEWQSIGISNITSFDISDLDRNGTKEFVLGTSNGEILIVDCETGNILNQQAISDYGISYIETAQIDTSGYERIFSLASYLKILDGESLSLLWQSELIGHQNTYNTPKQNIFISDIEQNQYMDLFAGTNYGVFHFESNQPYPDITPPGIKSYMPESAFLNASINVEIQVVFNEQIDTGTLTSETIILQNSDEEPLPFATTYTFNDDISKLIVSPSGLLPANDTIYITLTGLIQDVAGNGLDGNGNGISEGSPDDDFSWFFYTGSGIDTIPPQITDLELSANNTWKGIPVTLNVNISDSSSYAMSPITYAELFINEPGNHGEGFPLHPADGAFNSVYEEAYKIIDTKNMTSGLHIIYVRAKDLSGNWSDFENIEFNILREDEGNWSMYGHNPQHTSFNLNDTTHFPLKFKWSNSISSNIILEPIIINDYVFTTSRGSHYYNGQVVGMQLSNGEILWEKQFINPYTITAPSFGYGMLYLQAGLSNDYNTSVYAIDAISGEEIWASPFGSQWEDYLPPTIYDNKVFINGGHYGGAYAFSAQAGIQIWFHQLSQYDKWTPAVHDNVVYTFTGGSYNATLTAINANTGITIWAKNDIPHNWSGYSMNTSPVIDTVTNVIYVTSKSYVHAIDMETQEILWSHQGDFNITPALDTCCLYVVNNGQLHVRDKTTGSLLWTFIDINSILSPPAISNGHVALASEQEVKIIRISDQAVIWSFNQGGRLSIGNNHLVLSTNSGEVYCFESDLSTNINSIPLSQSVNVYPNPTRDKLWVNYSSDEVGNINLLIVDIYGQTIRFDQIQHSSSMENDILIDVSLLDAGMYFIYLQHNNNTHKSKFIKL
jgi:outer membrane protein assembly factor BamB